MAELGAIASVVGLAGAGIKLSKTLYQMGSKAVRADHNINRIATNVALFSSMLKHFGAVLKDSEALHSPECLATAEQIVRECDLVFEEIANMAVLATGSDAATAKGDQSTNTRKRKLSSALHRVKWYFEQPTVERLIAQLEYLKTTLSVLVQTLNLAIVTASAKALGQLSEKVAQEIDNERMHVETLIMARQLSIIILQQYNNTNNANMRHSAQDGTAEALEISGRVSPVISEATTDPEQENGGPKLLTHKANDPSDIIKVGGGNLEFLDRAMDPSTHINPPPIASTHNQIIDQLLGRWTRLPQLEEEINLRQQKQQQQQQHQHQQGQIHLEESDLLEPFEMVHATRESREQSPALEKTTSVLSLGSSVPSEKVDDRAKDIQPYAPTPSRASNGQSASNAWLDHALTVRSPDPISNQSLAPPPPISTSRKSSVAGASSPSSSAVLPSTGLQIKGIPPPPKANVSRSSTATLSPYIVAPSTLEKTNTPAADNSRFIPPLGIDSASAAPLSKPPELLASPISTIQSRAGPSPGTSPNMASSTMTYYTSSRRGIIEELPPYSPQKPHTAAQPSPPASVDSAEESSDDEEDGNRFLGLGIPWRIRIGQKYFDFLDARLVGPRTPYLPTEPMSWVYSHDNAQTEISGAWVCEEAIREKKYSYSSLQISDGSAYGSEGGRSNVEGCIMWRIALPLKFAEVEDLVEKTVELYRQKTSHTSHQEATTPRNLVQPRQTSLHSVKQQRTPEWDRSPRSSGDTFGSVERSAPGSTPGISPYWVPPTQASPKYPPPPPQVQQAPPKMGGILSGGPPPAPPPGPPPGSASPLPPSYVPPAPGAPPPGGVNFVPSQGPPGGVGFVPSQPPPALQHAYSDMSVPRYGAPPVAHGISDSGSTYAANGREVPFTQSSRPGYAEWGGNAAGKDTYYNAPRDPRDIYYNHAYRRDGRNGQLEPSQVQGQDLGRAKSKDQHASTARSDDGRARPSRGDSRHRSSHHKSSHHGSGRSKRKGEEKSSTSSSSGSSKLVSGRTMAKLAGLAAMLEGLDSL